MANIRLRSGFTFARLQEEMPLGILQLNTYLRGFNPSHIDLTAGDDNPIYEWVQQWASQGVTFPRLDDNDAVITSSDIERHNTISADEIGFYVNTGGDVVGYPRYVEFNQEVYLDDVVPSEFPNNEAWSWRQWFDAGGDSVTYPQQHGIKWYGALQDFKGSGAGAPWLNVSHWWYGERRTDPPYRTMNQREFIAIVEANAPPEEL